MRNPNACVSDPNAFVTDPGSSLRTVYEGRFDGQTFSVVETGQQNIQDLIESYAPYTDLDYMLHRLSLGDMSVVSQRSAMYGDFSGMPTNPVDAINLVHNAEEQFAQLTPDERKACNNDWRVWLSQLMSGTPVADPAADPAAESTKEVSPVEP